MAEISAKDVAALRKATGAGMMDCKKALAETGGDLEKAIEHLRKKGAATAEKRADRAANQGVVEAYIHAGGRIGSMVEVNCETDFVAKNEDFRAFAADAAALVVRETPADAAALGAKTLAGGESVESRRVALVQKIGENITIRRIARMAAKGRIASYVHGGKIGVLVDLTGGQDTLGKDLAMHVAASKPIAVTGDQVAPEIVEKERVIAAARAAESGKPAEIQKKMVDGAVAKYLAEVTLLAQPFVKGDGKQTVGQLVKAQGATVNGFALFVVGEGIEKKKDDFAAEVAAMTKA